MTESSGQRELERHAEVVGRGGVQRGRHYGDVGLVVVVGVEGEELEVYEYELSPIPLSKELLEYLGFRFDKADYMIKGWECYKLTKINRVYFTPAIFIEAKELTPPMGYVVTEDGERRFSISLLHRRNFVDNRIGTCWAMDLNEFFILNAGRYLRRIDVSIFF